MFTVDKRQLLVMGYSLHQRETRFTLHIQNNTVCANETHVNLTALQQVHVTETL